MSLRWRIAVSIAILSIAILSFNGFLAFIKSAALLTSSMQQQVFYSKSLIEDESCNFPVDDRITNKRGATNSLKSSIFHLHVPKSGGTAFSEAIASTMCKCPIHRRYIPGECKCPKSNYSDFPLVLSRLTTGWNCGVHPWLDEIESCSLFHNKTVGGFEDSVAIITFLRDPLARALSEYKHCGWKAIRGGDLGWCDEAFSSIQNLKQYTEMDYSHVFHNRQVKMISGCPKNTDWNQEINMIACLKSAKKNIERFGFVGIEEHFPFFLTSFSSTIGMNFTVPGANVHSVGGRLNMKYEIFINETNRAIPSMASLVAYKNRYDYELYNYTLHYLCQKYNSTGDE